MTEAPQTERELIVNTLAARMGLRTTGPTIKSTSCVGLAVRSLQMSGARVHQAKIGETVLVVDDEPMVRMLIVEILEDLGYRAMEAGDGLEGLKIIRSNVRIDLLITDVGLPKGMNGRQLADAARALRTGLKVLFITGYADTAVLRHNNLEQGMQVITKPFDLVVLAKRIQEMICG